MHRPVGAAEVKDTKHMGMACYFVPSGFVSSRLFPSETGPVIRLEPIHRAAILAHAYPG